MELETQGLRVFGAIFFANDPIPNPAGSPKLGDLLEEMVVAAEEERKPWTKIVDIQASLQKRLNIDLGVRQGEGDLLGRGGACLADMVARNRYGMEIRQIARRI